MNTIEEYSHQLFSSLLSTSRELKPFEFEGDKLCVGTGPLLTNSNGDLFYDFTGQCGLLGHGHPLSFKINLLRLLRDRNPIDFNQNRVIAEKFLSEFFNAKVYICQPSNEYQSQWPGRSSKFCEPILKGPINLKGLFSKTIAISTKKQDYFEDCLEEATTLKFLKLGQFYGKSGLIKQRELQLKSFFKGLDFIQSIEGLNISLNVKKLPDHFLLNPHFNNQLLFPLTFNEEILINVKTSLEKLCSP